MGMVLNTNIPSIQAQRALGESRKEINSNGAFIHRIEN